jgi:hypothetical protein
MIMLEMAFEKVRRILRGMVELKRVWGLLFFSKFENQ